MSLFELRRDPTALASGAGRGSVSATVSHAAEPTDRDTKWWTLAAIAVLAALGLAAVVGTVYVGGDGMWHLIWGRALADGTLSSFATGPTPHPSLLVLAAATSLLGDDTSYALTYVLFGPLAFGVLVAAVFEVARRLSSRWGAALAVLLLATSPGVLSIAGSARYDIAFAALVMTAVALEMARPRRGIAPLVCLAFAGLVRPEAWVVAGAYWLWVALSMSWPRRVRATALVAVAPALWVLMDVLVTGDPLYSLHVTDSASEEFYGQYTPWENLEAAGRNMLWYLGVFPLLALGPAAVLLVRDRPPAALAPLGALGLTLAVFLLLLSQGIASSERYLFVPVCVLTILAAVAVDGGGRRTPRRVLVGVFLAVFLCVHVASRTDVYGTTAKDAAILHGLDESSRALVGMPGVREALGSCPAVSLPTGLMRHWFAFYGGRAPESFISDGTGRIHPDLYIAPGNPAAAKLVLTRPRFDDDASYRVPPGLRRGPRNADWMLYVSGTSACTRGLR